MGWFSDDSNQAQSYNDYQGLQPHEHKASITHELLGGAVAYEAAKAYEDHRARNGTPDSHAKAKEIMAGIVGGLVDREFEDKGLNWLEKEEVKRHARAHVDDYVANDY
ncbi:hypothetical protein NP233_g5659 [Leucocoprinus birnbaumii]|uniref:Uncharacterized protein n=1 Tax=Leucocoprinus birnbaumii TaxID=56174 RepID=A0AAD5YWH7_9AGAR|nr:hypothetical protein NP233_g5659 [Leucocoprinus birnbaumii]